MPTVLSQMTTGLAGPPRSGRRAHLVGAVCAAAALAAGFAAAGRADVGSPMFYVGEGGTESRPQSKCWFADGSWWCVLLDGIDANYIYRLGAEGWQPQTPPGPFNSLDDARADVCLRGDSLYVLMWHDERPRLHKFVPGASGYAPAPGWGTPLEFAFASQTASVAVDSRGSVWIAHDRDAFPNDMQVAYSLGDDRSFGSTEFSVAEGADEDDICALTAFGGDRVGVFWSDQHNGYYGFRVHRDQDPPDVWQPIELVTGESLLVDDHVGLAPAEDGRVFAVVKTSYDAPGLPGLGLFVRDSDGDWGPFHGICATADSLAATKPIVLLSETENRVYVLCTNRAILPARIECCWSDMDLIAFGPAEIFMARDAGGVGLQGLDHVSAMKGGVDEASGLLAIATELSTRVTYYNRFAIPHSGSSEHPSCPTPGRLCVAPNPVVRGQPAVIRFLTPDGTATEEVRLRIHDGAGRLVDELRMDGLDGGVTVLQWDGRDVRGRSTGTGIYWLTARSGATRARGALLRLR